MRYVITGVDAAFSHMGFARMQFDTRAPLGTLTLLSLHLASTEGQDKKVVRKSSDDLRRARELVKSMQTHCEGSLIAAVEVPTGSQSSRAAWSLGIAVGVIASCPVATIEVSPLEVKLASVGKKTASKAEMIEWAMALYPHDDWILHRGKPTQANEHLADAVATIHAAMQTVTLKALCGMAPAPIRRRIVE